jgi:hypothetical protein
MSGVELFTIGSAAVTLADAATAVTAVTGALGSIAGANAQASAAEQQAAFAEQNAAIARQRAASDEARTRRENRRRQGLARATIGASGVTFEGSPLDVLSDSAAEAELDALTVRQAGELEASGFRQQARNARARASDARTAGRIGAGTALLSGASRLTGGRRAPQPRGTGLGGGVVNRGVNPGGTGVL